MQQIVLYICSFRVCLKCIWILINNWQEKWLSGGEDFKTIKIIVLVLHLKVSKVVGDRWSIV